MFASRSRTIARSLHRTAVFGSFRGIRVRPQLASPLPQPPVPGLRQFSTSSARQAQYSRFSDGRGYYSRSPNRDTVTTAFVFVTAAGAVYIFVHLEQVPETGRWRFMNISPWYEAKLAQTSYTMLLSEFGGKVLPAHHPITRHVHRVVSDLLEASDLGTLRATGPHMEPAQDDESWHDDLFEARPRRHISPDGEGKEWNLLVVNDPKIVNALASFGTIAVFTGILPVCKDEQGLAAVVGHEIGHTVARHESERYSTAKILIVFAILLQAVGIDFGIARMLNYLLFKLPNSRTQELEADTLGMRIAAKACYDPQSAVQMHTRLARASENGDLGSSFEFLRTHPLPERRIKHLEDLVPEANEIRAANPRCAGIRDAIEQFRGTLNRWG